MRLAKGVSHVHLALASDRDVSAATAALERLSPLQPMVAELSKKSALQQALCGTLVAILRPAARDGACF